MLPNNKWIHEQIKTEIRQYMETKQNYSNPKFVGCYKSDSKRKVHSSTVRPQETRTILNKQSKLTVKESRK